MPHQRAIQVDVDYQRLVLGVRDDQLDNARQLAQQQQAGLVDDDIPATITS